MKILYYRKDNELLPGIVTGKGIVAINNLNEQKKYSHVPLTNKDVEELKNFNFDRAKLIDEPGLEIGPCVPWPPKIICIGLNYRKHAVESGMAIPSSPILFTKYNNTLTDHNSNIPLGKEGEQFDYEVELGVVIGTRCKNVSKENALDHVLGYCVANDLSCRDLQFKTSQWLLGKSLDKFSPLGKYVVTADEVGDPQNLKLTCTLNGEQRQHSSTSDMIFPVSEIIEYVSKYMTLEPGDLLLTGTPEGVIMGRKEKNWLKPGDVVRVEIEKLGYSENRMT